MYTNKILKETKVYTFDGKSNYVEINNGVISINHDVNLFEGSNIKYLEKDEVEKIYNLTFEPFSTIDIVRDAFIFQCFTALRYSDVSALTHDNIIQNNEGYEIDILTEKDNDRVRYPLSRIATEIYEKYHQYEYPKGEVFPLVSNQKYNKHLKEIGQLAELQGEWIGYQYRLNEKIVVKTHRLIL